MTKIKQALIKAAIQNKKEDLKDNIKYWNEVISDVNNAADENRLLEIAQMDFGFDSFEQLIKNVL